jgi:hypothetical protein
MNWRRPLPQAQAAARPYVTDQACTSTTVTSIRKGSEEITELARTSAACRDGTTVPSAACTDERWPGFAAARNVHAGNEGQVSRLLKAGHRKIRRHLRMHPLDHVRNIMRLRSEKLANAMHAFPCSIQNIE